MNKYSKNSLFYKVYFYILGDKANQIKHPNLRYPTSAVPYKTSAIVSCDEGGGLLEFTSEGSFIGSITAGSFSDVTCVDESEVIGLECASNKLMVFAKSHKSWDRKAEVWLEYTTLSNQDTLLHFKENIFVSACRSQCIYVIRKSGLLLNTIR